MKFNILFDFDFIWGGFMGEVLGINVVDYNKNFMEDWVSCGSN